jgi:hypothetical protein
VQLAILFARQTLQIGRARSHYAKMPEIIKTQTRGTRPHLQVVLAAIVTPGNAALADLLKSDIGDMYKHGKRTTMNLLSGMRAHRYCVRRITHSGLRETWRWGRRSVLANTETVPRTCVTHWPRSIALSRACKSAVRKEYIFPLPADNARDSSRNEDLHHFLSSMPSIAR